MKYSRKKLLLLFWLLLLLRMETVLAQPMTSTVPNLPNFDLAKYNFGFYLGANITYFTVNPRNNFSNFTYSGDQILDMFADSARVINIEGKGGPGFVVGMVSQLRLSNHLDLRFVPGLQFGERSLNYQIESYSRGDTLMTTRRKNVISTFIDIPLHLKFKGDRIHNFRPYIYFGPSIKLDLATQIKKKDANMNELRIKLNIFDVAFDAGVGFDIYTNWFKFSTQFNMTYGIMNILHQENNIYSMSLQSLHTKIMQLTISFE
ncbi:MAG: porin family protein [Bacteroidales bacterium]|nr:porin family protein [Bacteroidales bacterium]